MKSITRRLLWADGFTLPEIMVGVVLLGLMATLGIGLVNAAKRLWPDASITVGREELPVAPSPAAYADAVRFHAALIEAIGSARAIYVFGGDQIGLPATASRVGASPLSATTLPELSNLPKGMPMDAETFYQSYAVALGTRETGFDPSDFTILILGAVGNQIGAIAMVQVRRRAVVVSDGTESTHYVRRDARLILRDETFRYAFLEKASDADHAAVGARHFWQRYAEGKVAEEGPVMTVFPDPWILAGSRVTPRGDGMRPFSQFMYVLPLSP